jgi:hypothetical protein
VVHLRLYVCRRSDGGSCVGLRRSVFNLSSTRSVPKLGVPIEV